jgi:hypothetical protein
MGYKFSSNLSTELETLRRQLDEELLAVERAWGSAEDFLELKELHSPPVKIRLGMIVLADGTDWDPGNGAGVYCYYIVPPAVSPTWNKLG